eukprot:TRINITY_DN43226_c0_g1_i2.p1 TRINITY_DN43226_c0_g1~~TRINITY_DN43226_c0_g1_i2.p1  ORF type:complete len:173 (-),score=12.26 TRINITY_DN43226_c0_g1_i2:241-759(-)
MEVHRLPFSSNRGSQLYRIKQNPLLLPQNKLTKPNSSFLSSKHRNNKLITTLNAEADPSVNRTTGFSQEFSKAVESFINKHAVVVFMKGNRDFPQCGFSNTVVQILNQMSIPYETVDVLTDNMLREGMKEFSQWPTFPQVYIGGEFYGGCDIMIDAYQSGTLQEELEKVMLS